MVSQTSALLRLARPLTALKSAFSVVIALSRLPYAALYSTTFWSLPLGLLTLYPCALACASRHPLTCGWDASASISSGRTRVKRLCPLSMAAHSEPSMSIFTTTVSCGVRSHNRGNERSKSSRGRTGTSWQRDSSFLIRHHRTTASLQFIMPLPKLNLSRGMSAHVPAAPSAIEGRSATRGAIDVGFMQSVALSTCGTLRGQPVW